MTLYNNTYRIESIRLKTWDYASNGWYYVTICTQNRQPFFGKVVNGQVELSAIGRVVADEWQKTAQIRPNMRLDAWVIMPNHMHGIIVIDWAQVEAHQDDTMVETGRGDTTVETGRGPSLHGNRFGPLQANSLQAAINGFKGAVTRWCRKNGFDHFGWQARYYEHIIRDPESLTRIRNYIANNPQKWSLNHGNPSGLWM